MKRSSFALLSAFLLLSATSVFAFPHEPRGYSDIEWGTRWEDVHHRFRDARRAPKSNNYYYEKRTPSYRWHGLRLTEENYVFSRSRRFIGVVLTVDDYSSYYRNAYDRAVREWGRPTDTYFTGGYESARWVGREVEIILTKTSRGWVLEYNWLTDHRPPPPPPPPPGDYRPHHEPPRRRHRW